MESKPPDVEVPALKPPRVESKPPDEEEPRPLLKPPPRVGSNPEPNWSLFPRPPVSRLNCLVILPKMPLESRPRVDWSKVLPRVLLPMPPRELLPMLPPVRCLTASPTSFAFSSRT